MTASDTQFADHPMNPYRKRSYAEEVEDFCRRANAVADRHVRTASPEFTRFLTSRLEWPEIAALFGALYASDEHRTIVRNTMAGIYEEFAEYVRTNPKELRTEIAREY